MRRIAHRSLPRVTSICSERPCPRTPSFNEADMSDKPPFMQAWPSLTVTDTLTIDHDYRKRLLSLLAVDEGIDALVSTLQSVRQLDNTYIVFASDNGYHMGQHRMLQGKATPYEEDIHVPLIVHGPGVPAGSVARRDHVDGGSGADLCRDRRRCFVCDARRPLAVAAAPQSESVAGLAANGPGGTLRHGQRYRVRHRRQLGAA